MAQAAPIYGDEDNLTVGRRHVDWFQTNIDMKQHVFDYTGRYPFATFDSLWSPDRFRRHSYFVYFDAARTHEYFALLYAQL
jgi:hypothetical protein